MLNKIQINRKKIAVLGILLLCVGILPILMTSKIEIVLVALWILLVIMVILFGSLLINGVVLMMKVLTYLGTLVIAVIVGLILYFFVDLPDNLDKSGVISIIVVVINLYLIQGLRLPAVAGHWIAQKLDPSLQPTTDKGHGGSVETKPYSDLFGNRIEHITAGKSYAPEASSGLLRALRFGLSIGMYLVGTVGFFIVIEVTSFAETYGEFGVYLGIYVCFALWILGSILMMSGFVRFFLGLLISVPFFGVLVGIVMGMNALYVQSLILFWMAILMGILVLMYGFYRLIKAMDMRLSRNLVMYEQDATKIGFDLNASYAIPLKGFNECALLTFKLSEKKIDRQILRLTDKIRFYTNYRRIVMAGYQTDPSSQSVQILFYAENAVKLRKLSRYVEHWIKRPLFVEFKQDPDNTAFKRLVPETMRLIEIMNELEILRMKSYRFDLDRLYRVGFYVRFEDIALMDAFKAIAEEMGYGSTTIYPEEKVAIIVKEVIMSLDLLNKTCQKIHQLAQSYGGSFSGWDFFNDRQE